MAVTEALSLLFSRDLRKIADEIQAYKKEEVIWYTDHQVSNSAGNLALHICGNLQHFIGATLGGSGYVREREKEFNTKNTPVATIVDLLAKTERVVVETLKGLTAADLQEEYPLGIGGREWQTGKTDGFLLHLLAHLNYHLGQINYHRRLLDK